MELENDNHEVNEDNIKQNNEEINNNHEMNEDNIKQDHEEIDDSNEVDQNLNQQNNDIKNNKKDSFVKNKNYNITGIYQKETPNNYNYQNKEKLEEKLQNIQKEIINKNQNIEKINNKLDSISQNKVPNKLKKQNSYNKTKMLNHLHSKSSNLQISINDLNKAQLNLENESYLNLPKNTSEIIQKEKLKNIKIQKEMLILKLNDINSQINSIVEKENKNNSKKELIKDFLENFENDKEKFSGAMIAFSKEVYRKRKEKNDERLRKEEENERIFQENLKIKKREKELKKIEFMNSQKRLEEKIKEKNNKIINHTKKFIHCSPSNKDKNYITSEEREIMRKEEENQLLNLQLLKRKELFKPISSQELNEFTKEVINNEKRTFAELEQKKIQLGELFKERKDLLPKYHSQFYKINIDNEKEFLNRENNRIEKINEQKQKRKLFDKEVKKLYFPKNIDERLKKQREEIISSLKGENRIEEIKNLKKNIQKLSKKYQPPPIKINNSQSNNNKIKLKNGFVTERSRNKDLINLNSIDYLSQFRKERELKNNKSHGLSLSVGNKENWDKMINNKKNNRNIYNNIFDIRVKADQLQKEAEFKTQLYKLDPVHNNNMRDEITDLYINSIQGKLQILKSINDSNNN